MKPYIIAAALFVTAFLILGVLTANVMAPPEPPPQAHVPPPNQRPSGGMPSSGEAASTDPAAQTYPAAMPSTRPAATPSSVPGPGALPLVPGMPMPPPGLPSAGMPGMPPGSGTAPGTSNPMNISAPAAIPMPRPSSIEPTGSVPIIQPTDTGTPTTPTAAKAHQ